MKRGFISLAVAFAAFVFLISNASAIFMGITDGYIFDNNGAVVSGASVTVTVTGCSGGAGNGCVKTATSAVNGYYAVNNLNLPSAGQVSVAVTKNGGSGSGSGTASNYVAHVNITICYPPSVPSLTDVPDGTNTTVIFNWASGTDPLGLAIHDDFKLDAAITSPATSPQTRTASYASHSWGARTCNNYCCSSWAADSFTITCAAPSAPSLTPVPDSHNTTAKFTWISGTDPLGKPVHDVFVLDGSTTDPGVSPITRTSLSFASHTWSVKTCNADCCSALSSNTFTIFNNPPSAPNNTNATVYNATTSLTWASGTDPEGDPIYDEFQYDNGTTISPATSPFNVTTALLIKWKVRTCDSFGACSSWVSVDSVTCSQISPVCPTCPTCPTVSGGGCPPASGGGFSGAGVGCRKVEFTCNGIPILNETLFRLNLYIDKHNKKFTGLSIYGQNMSLEKLEYCPWCYDGIKDYDEEGVDCGGSCRDCTEVEVPVRTIGKYFPKWVIAIILAFGLLVFYLWLKTDMIHRLFGMQKKK